MATYYSGIHGISFRVDCSNSITGTYPDIKHKVSYTIYLQHDYSQNRTDYDGAPLHFGSNTHYVNIHAGGAGAWPLVSGTLEYTFATNNRKDSRDIYFSTSFGTGPYNISASGSQTESATISIPNIKDIELSSTYNSISYKVTLESNPYNFYTIKATLDKDSKIGVEGKFEGLLPNKEYEIHCYVRYQGDTSVLVDNPVDKFIKTKKPNKPKAGKVKASNITYKSAYISWDGFSIQEGATDYYYQSSMDGDNWTDRSKGTNFELSGLIPYTEYTVYIRIVDNFSTPSDSVKITFTTAKPDKPSKGSVTYTDLNPFGATFTWSGFQIKEGASSYFYQYSFDRNIWKNLQTETKLVVSNLVPETTYTFYIRIVDNFDSVSDYASAKFVTPADQAKVAYNQDITEEKIMTANGFELTDMRGNPINAVLMQDKESLRTAKLWLNYNGKIKKIKKIYFNDKGTIKVHKNFGS